MKVSLLTNGQTENAYVRPSSQEQVYENLTNLGYLHDSNVY